MNNKLTQIDDDVLDQVSGGQGVSLGATIPFEVLGGLLSWFGSVLSSFQGYGLTLSVGIDQTAAATTESST
jgi:hypothetical protein